MRLKSHFMTLARAYCAETGLSETRLSTIVLGSGARLASLGAGKDLTTATYERAMGWFSANWPDGAAWPEWPEERPGWLERDFQPAGPAAGGLTAAAKCTRRRHASCGKRAASSSDKPLEEIT